jgi:hypothetical protein
MIGCSGTNCTELEQAETYFEMMLCEIKICPISFKADEARRRLRNEGLLPNTKRLSLFTSNQYLSIAAL